MRVTGGKPKNPQEGFTHRESKTWLKVTCFVPDCGDLRWLLPQEEQIKIFLEFSRLVRIMSQQRRNTIVVFNPIAHEFGLLTIVYPDSFGEFADSPDFQVWTYAIMALKKFILTNGNRQASISISRTTHGSCIEYSAWITIISLPLPVYPLKKNPQVNVGNKNGKYEIWISSFTVCSRELSWQTFMNCLTMEVTGASSISGSGVI